MEQKVEVDQFFPRGLIETYSKPNPAEESQLEEYVSTLINSHPDVNLQLDILFKTATIDILNEPRNFWIIKKAFEIASFDGEEAMLQLAIVHNTCRARDFLHGKHFDPKKINETITYERYIPSNGSSLQKFLLKLKSYIPQSPFLWFYLQCSLQPIAKNDWMALFDTYNLKNIKEVKEAIFTHFIQEWLHCTPEFKAVCIEHVKGTIPNTLVACEKLFALHKEKGNIPKAEFNIAAQIFNRTVEQCTSDLIGDERPLCMAILEFKKGNYKKVIELLKPILSNPQEKKNHTSLEWNTIYGILAKCHELLGETDKALVLYETVYPCLVLSAEKNYGQKELAFEAIISLKSKVDVNSAQTDFFKNDTNPLTLYNQCVEQAKQNKYSDAIISCNKALAIYILQKGLISKECIQCYSLAAVSFKEMGDLDTAYLQCNMAYALARQLYKDSQDELQVIETQLRQLEIEAQLQSEEGAEVHRESKLTS